MEGPDSPTLTSLSMKIDQSMDHPVKFSQGDRNRKSVHMERPGSPTYSCLSMKSDMSKDWLIEFQQKEKSVGKSVHMERPDSPTFSCLSMKSDMSKDWLIEFQQKEKSMGESVHMERPGSPTYSCLSMKSDMSKDWLIEFQQKEKSTEESVHMERPGSPTFSCLSMKSDMSKDWLIEFQQKEKSVGKSVHMERPDSPTFSCLSMKSDMSKDWLIEFQQKEKSMGESVHMERPGSPSFSCLSMKSDMSKDWLIEFQQKEKSMGKSVEMERPHSLSSNCLSSKIDTTMDQAVKLCHGEKSPGRRGQNNSHTKNIVDSDVLSLLEQTLNIVDMDDFLTHLCRDFPEIFEILQRIYGVRQISQKILEKFGTKYALKTALKYLLKKDQHPKTVQDQLASKLKHQLKSKFECIYEGNAQQGNLILLNDIFTELYITEGGGKGVVKEHEVRQIEDASKNKHTQEAAVKCNDIFKPLPGQKKCIRTVLTKGIAGIGKTVSVHKFILDWAEGKANQDIHLLIPLPFRDLNLKKNDKYSILQLIHHYFPALEGLKIMMREEIKTLFIFDGLDECRLPLDFRKNEMCCDPTKEISVDVLLTNLIQGNLLPSALLWITSRPAAASLVPPKCVDRLTEVRGFNDSEKEEYFRKRFHDVNVVDKIVRHMKSSRSLHIMCHIPVFCWISATVLEKIWGTSDSGEVPKTLTEMYTYFLLIQTSLKNKKYHGVTQKSIDLSEPDKELITKLGKLAFQQLEEGNLIFYEKDLTDCGIDVSKASEYSAVCTEIFKEESGLYSERVYCFVHLSIQEHLAAMYVLLTFVNSNVNLLNTEQHTRNSTVNILNAEEQQSQRSKVRMADLHKTAVDRALKSENGHLDLFLRFLLGLSLESNRALLRGLFSICCSESTGQTVEYIKERIRKESSAQRTINLFHCLNELNYNSVVEEIHGFLRSAKCSNEKLKPEQCSALAYVLMTSEDVISEFDLKMCNTSLAGYQRLLPVVRTSRRAILAGVNFTDESCETLASMLQSSTSQLTELDLSFNNLGDLGVKLLCVGLSSPHCKLEKLNLSYNNLEDIGVKLLCRCVRSPHSKLEELRLAGNSLTSRSCELIASALQSSSHSVRDLDLGSSNMRDSGVMLLSAGLLSRCCKLEKLRLGSCDLTHESCETLATVLQSSSSCVRELDLSYNKLGDSGVKLLCDGFTHPDCKLEKLDLSHNSLGHSGVKFLCAGLTNPSCKLQNIRLANISIPVEACETLASVLQSVNPHLRELELSHNCIGDTGVKLLCVGLKSPNCHLEKLSLSWCNLTEGSCSDLASVLCSQSKMRDLELRDNDLQDSGVKLLSAGLVTPHCSLQRLGLSGCCVSEEGCAALVSALSTKHSHLQELDLSYNHPGEEGMRQLSVLLDNQQCKLEKLSVEHGGEGRIKKGLKKYSCELTLDPNTAHRTLIMSGTREVTKTKEEQPYPDHADRFENYAKVLSKENLNGSRFYWEAEWTGNVIYIGMTYKGINRKSRGRDGNQEMNDNSWILFCSNDYGYYVSYKNKETLLPAPNPPSKRMGIYLDWPAGILSFYIISPDAVSHTYTYHTTFTEPLYALISLYNQDDTAALCAVN